MGRTVQEILSRALDDVGEGRHVALSPELALEASRDRVEKQNGACSDVAMITASRVTAEGEVEVHPFPVSKSVWAIIPQEAAETAFVASLAAPTGRVARVYHPLAVVDIDERGVVVRKVVRGTSARDVARVFGVPCFASPDLEEWHDEES